MKETRHTNWLNGKSPVFHRSQADLGCGFPQMQSGRAVSTGAWLPRDWLPPNLEEDWSEQLDLHSGFKETQTLNVAELSKLLVSSLQRRALSWG